GHLDQGAVLVGAGEPAADRPVLVGQDVADLGVQLGLFEQPQVGGELVDQVEVGGRQRRLGPLDGEQQPAGGHVIAEGLFEEGEAADAGQVGGEEADVVVLRIPVPGGGDQGEEDGGGQPGGADL